MRSRDDGGVLTEQYFLTSLTRGAVGRWLPSLTAVSAFSPLAMNPQVQDALAALLRTSADEIVAQWSRDLKSAAFQAYSDRPLDELESDCRQCLDGYIVAIGDGDYSRIRRFITREVRARVHQGFRASEIMRKFAAFEAVVWPLVLEHFALRVEDAATALWRVNACVSNALFEFSDLYETASQQRVEEYMAEMEAMNRRLEEISVRDPLTGLYNRRYFEDRLGTEFQRAHRHGRPLTVLMADIDHFKSINDTYGHQTGDEVLRGVGLLLVNQTRATDITARYGGEEFVAVLPETDATGALRVAEKLRESVAVAPLHRLVSPSGEAIPLHCTVSIGVHLLVPGIATPDALVRGADEAMYAAKQGGRNRVVCRWDSDTPQSAT